jgi:branched-chain amino acid transport system permease protein
VSATVGAWRGGPGRPSPGLALRGSGACVLLAALAVFPLVFTNQVTTRIGVDTLIFVAAAVAWNLFSGYSGYISLGHAVFFGSGAYTAGIAARDWHITGSAEFALLPLACAVAAVIAVPFGLIALRVRRHTFVVITIAVFFIFQLMALNFGFTSGTNGLNAPFLPWPLATFNNAFYYMALGIAAGTVGLSWLIKGSRFGLQLRAIRDDEERARGLGVRTMRVKLGAFVISGAVTGLLGALWFFYLGQVLPQSGFDPLFDLSVALMAFFGGLGTVSGPVLGALILEPGQQYLTLRITNDYLSQILLGALFLAVILLLPRGAIPTATEKIAQWRARRSGGSGETSVPPGVLAAAAAGGDASAAGAAGGAGDGGATVGVPRKRAEQ